MKNLSKKTLCEQVIQSHIDRMHELCDNNKVREAEALYSEIRDWVVQKENLEVLSLDFISHYFTD